MKKLNSFFLRLSHMSIFVVLCYTHKRLKKNDTFMVKPKCNLHNVFLIQILQVKKKVLRNFYFKYLYQRN